MGRKRKYFTKEEQTNARRERQMRYYWKNLNEQRIKALERYYENKRNLQDN
jgi:cytochrome c553